MKKIIALSALFIMSSAFASDILGTQVLKGNLKTAIVVNGQPTACKVEIDNVKNMMEEDSYGNPAYKLQLEVKLVANEGKEGSKTLVKRSFNLNNLLVDGSTSTVRDFDYKSADGATMKINAEGRLVSVGFPFENQIIRCSF